MRSNVGMLDISTYGKLLVQGRDATTVLQRVCANDVDVEPGQIVYTQWLNEFGGIEADLTVTRLDEHEFLVLSAPAIDLPRPRLVAAGDPRRRERDRHGRLRHDGDGRGDGAGGAAPAAAADRR